jgi:hypothetical protein
MAANAQTNATMKGTISAGVMSNMMYRSLRAAPAPRVGRRQ